MKLHLWKPLCYCGLPRTTFCRCTHPCSTHPASQALLAVSSDASTAQPLVFLPSFLPPDMKIMGIKGSWLWLGGFSVCAGPQPITLGRLLFFCAAAALGFRGVLILTYGSGQGRFCRLAWGGFGNTSEGNTQLHRRAAGLGMWLVQGQGLGQCSGVMLSVSAPCECFCTSPQCCGRTWGHLGT